MVMGTYFEIGDEGMFLVKLYMKSRNIIEFKTKELTKTKNGYGTLVGLEWENCSKDKQLSYIADLSDIEAIVVDEID